MFTLKNIKKFKYWVQFNFCVYLKKILKNSIKKIKIHYCFIELKTTRHFLHKVLTFLKIHTFCKFENLLDIVAYLFNI